MWPDLHVADWNVPRAFATVSNDSELLHIGGEVFPSADVAGGGAKLTSVDPLGGGCVAASSLGEEAARDGPVWAEVLRLASCPSGSFRLFRRSPLLWSLGPLR